LLKERLVDEDASEDDTSESGDSDEDLDEEEVDLHALIARILLKHPPSWLREPNGGDYERRKLCFPTPCLSRSHSTWPTGKLSCRSYYIQHSVIQCIIYQGVERRHRRIWNKEVIIRQ